MTKLTRRRWIAAAGATAAASSLPVRGASAAKPRSEAQPLPPPPKPDVYRERQARLRAGAKARGWDALLVTPSTNLAYASGLAMGRSERLTALILFSDGPAVLVTPSFEESNVTRDATVDEVKTWKEDEDPNALAAKLLAKKTVGVEGSTAFSTASLLAAAADARTEDATAVFDALRAVKSEDELAFIKDAGRRTVAAISATHEKLQSGMSERDVSTILSQEFLRRGVRGDGLVQFGPSAALPHGGPGDRELTRGDAVLIDCGCRVRGYTSDVTRTVAFGPPSDEFRKVYAIVDRAQMAGIEALAAGKSGEEVDGAARKVIGDVGYGAYFTHRLGHGLGMDGHEQPYLVKGNTKPLVAGNVVTVEPGIYLPGKFGVRIEDDYGVREKGLVSLSVRPQELVVLKG
ncbi:MAG TPA: Xaa-Pro peptidase family protein [Thermoanaerobaculia bacterium]|jgi:Xaa-Pro dipeptidase|nr:Xaa-Pro peptidase family protein [Thermoanaerobaculia bacterium]